MQMQYRKFKSVDKEISLLGLGVMRLPRLEDGKADEKTGIDLRMPDLPQPNDLREPVKSGSTASSAPTRRRRRSIRPPKARSRSA